MVGYDYVSEGSIKSIVYRWSGTRREAIIFFIAQDPSRA